VTSDGRTKLSRLHPDVQLNPRPVRSHGIGARCRPPLQRPVEKWASIGRSQRPPRCGAKTRRAAPGGGEWPVPAAWLAGPGHGRRRGWRAAVTGTGSTGGMRRMQYSRTRTCKHAQTIMFCVFGRSELLLIRKLESACRPMQATHGASTAGSMIWIRTGATFAECRRIARSAKARGRERAPNGQGRGARISRWPRRRGRRLRRQIG
jgi:hypothetical protein